MKKHTRIALPFALTALLGLPTGMVQASGEAPANAVGAVSLVVGKAWVQRPGAERERIRTGTEIGVYDSIETSTNGHVHIHFVDDALVSVRPSSTLEVLRYDYDAAHPTQSAVKFNLVEGVFRAISGQAAKNARENFRLNTPIAAIGVRGTDFVVSADKDAVRALVTEGVIVVTPYSSQCLVDALGPCSQSGVELAGGTSQIVQISANSLIPVLLPIAPGIPEAMVGSAVTPPEEKSEPSGKASGELYADSVTTRAVNQTIAVSRAVVAPEPAPVVPVVIPEFTPDVAITSPALAAVERQLVWGRYALSDSNERITLVYDPLSSTLDGRKGTVGNNHYSLFRYEVNGNQNVQAGLGVVAFNLDKAQAQYTTGGVTSLMDVNGGNLSIDFNQNQYSTSLNLSHAATGAIVFADSGRLFAGGYFHDIRTEAHGLAGAVSLDGKEAGYFFEETLANGRMEGLTLWGRKP